MSIFQKFVDERQAMQVALVRQVYLSCFADEGDRLAFELKHGRGRFLNDLRFTQYDNSAADAIVPSKIAFNADTMMMTLSWIDATSLEHRDPSVGPAMVSINVHAGIYRGFHRLNGLSADYPKDWRKRSTKHNLWMKLFA